MEPVTVVKIGGEVKRTFPARGFVWLCGEDGVDYFGHASHFKDGVDIFSTWVGQKCRFKPNDGDGPHEKGPYATEIEMEGGVAA